MSPEEHIVIIRRILKQIQFAPNPEHAIDNILVSLAELLSGLPIAEVRHLRKRVETLFSDAEVDANEVLILIDGHLVYRDLVGANRPPSEPDTGKKI